MVSIDEVLTIVESVSADAWRFGGKLEVCRKISYEAVS